MARSLRWNIHMGSAGSGGFTVVEVVIVLAIVAVMTAVAVPSMRQWSANQRLKSSAREISSVFSYARSEAIRTGNVHLVLFQEDAQGNALTAAPIVVLDDGHPGAMGQNCAIDGGEPTKTFQLEAGVSFGLSKAGGKVTSDAGSSTVVNGSTFENASSQPATWVLFRPEGAALAFSSDCSMGSVGSGGGGIYLTNGERDVAVVLSPLGATRLHSWDDVASSWSS